MIPSESITHSFIVKIWLEEVDQKANDAMWHGHVTHVPSGKRSYLQDLDDLTRFVKPYLEELGVNFGWRWRIQHKWNRRNLFWRHRK